MKEKKGLGGSLLLCAVSGMAQAAGPGTLSIYACHEAETCDVAGRCVSGETRLYLAQVSEGSVGPYYSMGPLVPQAGGGLFFQQDWRWSPGGLPLPSEDTGAARVLSVDPDGRWTAHVYRPGREVAGLSGSDWVRADYNCEQVMF